MPTPLPKINLTDSERCAKEAAQSFVGHNLRRPDGRSLTAALLHLEKSAKQTRLSIPLEDLLGTWRLCFSAGKKAKFQAGEPVGNGFYIPQWAIARITFTRDDRGAAPLKIANELSVGPLDIRFTGPARYPGKKNLLVFDFTHLEVTCFGVRVYRGSVGRQSQDENILEERAIAKLPFFAFFAATDDYIAARGRGGGLAIWVKPEK